jgi:5'-nucleotidase
LSSLFGYDKLKALKKIAEVIVVAPDREQSGIGTAVTLRQPLRMHRVDPLVPEVEAYSIEGTPADSVILGLTKLAESNIDLVVSGINPGANLGDNVLISGTVGAALQGYLHGLPAIAVSVNARDSPYLDTAAELAALLARRIEYNHLPSNIFLNVNLPNLPLTRIKGLEITRLASRSHTDEVEEGHDGKQVYYRLIRQTVDKTVDNKTDIWAMEQGHISITPLQTILVSNPSPLTPDSLSSELLQELQKR